LASYVGRLACPSALATPIRIEQRLWGCLLGCAGECRSFVPSDLSTFSLLAASIALAIENTRLRAESELRLSEAMSLEAVSAALVGERSLDAILGMIIDKATRLLHASDALVLLLEEGGKTFQVRARRGQGVAELKRGQMSVAGSLNGQVISTGKPLVSQDACTDRRANQARARRLKVKTVAIAPLKIRDTTIGTIAVHNKQDGYFGPTDVEVLCSFANQAAVAIDNARLFQELLRARDEIELKAQELQGLLVETMHIQENERRRIAADLHERVVSRVVGALYEVETCIQASQSAPIASKNPRPAENCGDAHEGPDSNEALTRDESKSLQQRLQLLKELLNEAIETTRTSIYDLWPAALDHMGLIPALRGLLSQQEERTGVRHVLRVHGTPYQLRPDATIAVYRIVQEAMNNSHTHGQASQVQVTIHFHTRNVRLMIQDNGQGFDVHSVMLAPPARHFGLIGMRERALSVGGQLVVNSMPGGGSEVIVEIPSSSARLKEGRESSGTNSCLDRR
jgi:signal transduction histidine kinase